MSWHPRDECTRCGGITGWAARYAPERIRCKCGFRAEEMLTERLSDPLRHLEPKRAA